MVAEEDGVGDDDDVETVLGCGMMDITGKG